MPTDKLTAGVQRVLDGREQAHILHIRTRYIVAAMLHIQLHDYPAEHFFFHVQFEQIAAYIFIHSDPTHQKQGVGSFTVITLRLAE